MENSKSSKKLLIGICVAVVVVIIALCAIFVKPSYKSQIKSFGKALGDSKKMEKFVDKNIDFRAIYAMEKVNEREDLDGSDKDAVEKAFKEEYKKAKKSEYKSEDNVKEVKETFTGISKELAGDDTTVEIKDIGKLEKDEDFPFFEDAKFTLKVKKGDEEQELKLYAMFYKKKFVMINIDSDSFETDDYDYSEDDYDYDYDSEEDIEEDNDIQEDEEDALNIVEDATEDTEEAEE